MAHSGTPSGSTSAQLSARQFESRLASCSVQAALPPPLDRTERWLYGYSLESEYPYNHRSVRSSGGGSAACTEQEASLLSNCLADNCADVEPEGVPLCAIANCAGPFTEVSMPCQQCIA